jgi:hypothetical protein
MEHGNGASDNPLDTLIPREGFKAVLGADDRERLPYHGYFHHRTIL